MRVLHHRVVHAIAALLRLIEEVLLGDTALLHPLSVWLRLRLMLRLPLNVELDVEVVLRDIQKSCALLCWKGLRVRVHVPVEIEACLCHVHRCVLLHGLLHGDLPLVLEVLVVVGEVRYRRLELVLLRFLLLHH
jgi:hypothetical protein